MSLGSNRAEQELTRRLVETLVKPEVIAPMERIGWSHGTPPPPDQSGPPAPAEGAPASAPAPPAAPASGPPAGEAAPPVPPAGEAKADTPQATDVVSVLESMRDPVTGLIAKKYKTVPEAIKGMGHLANMAKQAFQERDAALAASVSLEAPARTQPVAAAPAAVSLPTPAPLIASRATYEQVKAKYDAVLARLDDGGDVVDVNTLRTVGELQREVAEAAADLRVQENLHARDSATKADQDRWSAADAYMGEHHPGSLELADEIGLNIASDPVLQEAISSLIKKGDLVKASVMSWEAYQKTVANGTAATVLADAKAKEEDLSARGQVRQELLAEARKDAGVIHGSGGQGIHRNDNAGSASQEEMAALQARMRIEGDGLGMPAATRFRRQLLKDLDPAIFGPQ